MPSPGRDPRRHRRRRRGAAPGARRARVPARRARLPGLAAQRRQARARSATRRSRCRPSRPRRFDGVDIALFSAGAHALARVGADRRRARRGRRRQLVRLPHGARRAAGRRRREPAGRARPPRPRREPELLDDAADAGAEADPRRGRPRARHRLDLPGGVRHRPVRRSTACATRRAARSPATPPAAAVYPHPIAFNVIPVAGSFAGDDGYTDEELKLVNETRKILDAARPARVRHLRARAGRDRPLRGGVGRDARAALARRSCATCSMERRASSSSTTRPSHAYPTALDAVGSDDVFVGRIRRDLGRDNGLAFWVVSDNLRKGAATNAVADRRAARPRRPAAARAARSALRRRARRPPAPRLATAATPSRAPALVVGDRHDAAQLEPHQLDAARRAQRAEAEVGQEVAREDRAVAQEARAELLALVVAVGERLDRVVRRRRAPRRCRPGTGSAAPTGSRRRPGTST